MDICPLCKSKITESHINEIHKEIHPNINNLQKEMESSDKELSGLYNKIDTMQRELEDIVEESSIREPELIKSSNKIAKKDKTWYYPRDTKYIKPLEELLHYKSIKLKRISMQ